MKKNTFAIVAFCAALPFFVGTSRAEPPSPAAPILEILSDIDMQNTESVENDQNAPNAQNTQNADDTLPKVELTKQLLYKLLHAELVYQEHNDWRRAYMDILASAKETRDPRLARRATEIALQAEQMGEALVAVRLWRQLEPDSRDASQFHLGLMLVNGNFADAKRVLAEQLQKAAPEARGELIFRIRQQLGVAQDKQAAWRLFEELLAPWSFLPESHLAMAQAALLNLDNARAHQAALRALKIKPDMEIAAIMAARTMPNRQDAQAFLAAWLQANPKARNVRIAYTSLLIEGQEYAKARGQFEILLADNPKDLMLLYSLGILGAQMNNHMLADKYLRAYLHELGEDPEPSLKIIQVQSILAQIATARKDYQDALSWLAHIEPGPGYVDAQIRIAQIMAHTGDIKGAENVLGELEPKTYEDHIQLMTVKAQLLNKTNRAQEALALLEEGARKFSDNVNVLYDLAMAAEKVGQLELMEQSLRRIIALTPNNQHAYNALGYSLADRNVRLQEAYLLLQKASQLAPDDPFIMDSVGWVYFRMGNLDKAEAYLRRALQIRPEADIAIHLGEVLWLKGNQKEARELWRAARKIAPDSAVLKNTLARLRVEL